MTHKTRVWRRPNLKDIQSNQKQLIELLGERVARETPQQPRRIEAKVSDNRRRIVRQKPEQEASDPELSGKAPRPEKAAAPQPEFSKTLYWRKESSYYMATLCQDLFSNWNLLHEWGKLTRRGRRQKQEVFQDKSTAEAALCATDVRRKELGYQAVNFLGAN